MMAMQESGLLEYWSPIGDWFWNEKVWLSANFTWEDVAKSKNFPPATDLGYCLPIVLSYLLIQLLLQRLIFRPIARLHGIRVKQIVPPSIPVLESAYLTKKKSPTDFKQIKSLAEDAKLSERQVERWFRQREQLHKGGKFKKVKESGWKAFYTSFICSYGIYCLWDKSWAWNVDECWDNVSSYKMTNDVWWYYMFSISYYVYLGISQFTDVKRKDFWQMLVHHVATVILIACSFLMNIVRYGSLILICHDIADIALEIGKVMKYLKKSTICNVCFVAFVLIWFPTRLGYYPLILVPSAVAHSYRVLGSLRYLLILLLYVLQLLHIMWSWMILKVLHRALFQGELDDVRSDSEDSSSETAAAHKKSN